MKTSADYVDIIYVFIFDAILSQVYLVWLSYTPFV